MAAVAAVLIAIAALVVASLSGSDSGSADSDDTSEALAEAAALLTDVQETVAAAQAAADRAQEAAARVSAASTAAEQAAADAASASELARESAASAAVEAAAASRLVAGASPDGSAADTPSDSTDSDDADDPPEVPTDGESGAAAASEDELPGEPYNDYGPASGAALAVVGVEYDSRLNVRDVPIGDVVARLSNSINADSESAVIVSAPDSPERLATLDLNSGVIATGNTRRLKTTVWHEIRMGAMRGWASSAFLSPLGANSDVTADVIDSLGETPSAPSLTQMAQIVARWAAAGDSSSRVVVSGAPVDGDPGEVTVDVLDLPDDSIRGYRLQISAARDNSGPYTLRSVESTLICSSHRGVSDSGVCN
ncbi:MAG: hypothetical protein OXE79_05810 [Acidimicrobiaceae bacterium]|nr:hypothetical protein [Acidimicrobiaceae bacterium]MCY4280236.1 hypothetical protein [Acidimicrobiaceae bacterium]MCY4293582.1 hypothetical protein [Acidimicrobiaceae bacterium]